MKYRMAFVGLATAALFFCLLSPGQAQDTSPYLMGVWEHGVYTYTNPSPVFTVTAFAATNFQISNPTTRDLDIYAVYYLPGGGSYFDCAVWYDVPPNGTAVFFTFLFEFYHSFDFPYTAGTVKFFAFPAGTRKFDPNAVIGGFQGKASAFYSSPIGSWTKSNLKAVTINSTTLPEFNLVPPGQACYPMNIF